MSSIPMTVQERIPLPAPIGARPGGAAAAGLTPADIIRILKQRMLLILTLWILISGVTVAGTFYLDRNYRTYGAKGYVKVESPYPRTPNQLVESSVPGELMNRYVADQAMLMKEDSVLREALTDPAVMATSWYQNLPDKTLVVERLKEQLSANPNQGTSFITVGFTARVPDDAATVVNTVMARYLERIQQMAKTSYVNDLKDYNLRVEELKKKIEDNRAKKRAAVTDINSPGITQNLNVVGETLRAHAQEVNELMRQKLEAQALHSQLQGVDPNELSLSPDMMMTIQADPTVSNLQNNRNYWKQQLAITLAQFGPNHRSVQPIQTQLEVVEKDLQEAIAKKEKDLREFQINSAFSKYQQAMAAELAMRESMTEIEAKERDLDKAVIDYRDLEDQYLLLADELKQVQATANALQLMINERGMIRVQTYPAVKPQTPNFPQWSLMIPGGSLFGLVLGLGLALLLELTDTSVRTPRDIVRHVHVPILGTVPDLDDEEISIDRIELAAHEAPRSMTAESFRSIRTNLLLSSPAERQRTVLITSARPEEGKTAIACNLAISIGQSGRRVLLVDANFHRPTLHTVFNKPQNQGLSNALIGQARLDDLIQKTELPNVDVITSGPIPPNPTELLSGTYLRELIVEAAGRYDQILFDGPPILLLSDSLVLATSLDGVIMVCRAKSTSRGAVQRAREQIERVNGRIFGAILNAARIRRGGYFREQIRTYYDYQPEEVLAAQTTKSLPKADPSDESEKS